MRQLVLVLAGRAREAYAEMDAYPKYPEVKAGILSQFEITPEVSQIKMRRAQFQPRDDVRAHIARIKMLARRWLIPPEHPDKTDVECLRRMEHQVIEETMMEQLFKELPREWQPEYKPEVHAWWKSLDSVFENTNCNSLRTALNDLEKRS